MSQVLDRTKDVIVIEVDQGLRFPGNDHLKQTILDEALDGKPQDDHSHTNYSVFSRQKSRQDVGPKHRLLLSSLKTLISYIVYLHIYLVLQLFSIAII